MRKILLLGLICIFCLGVFAQSISSINNPALANSLNVLSPEMQSQHEANKFQSFQNAQSLVPQTFTIDYEWYDSQSWAYYTSFIWNLHSDYSASDLVITPDPMGGPDDTLFWKFSQAATVFSWYNDSYATNSYGYPDSITIDHSQATTIIDSIFYQFGYQNYSGLTAEIRTRVIALDGNGFPDFNTILWEDILQIDTSLTDAGYIDVRALAVDFALPNAGDRFAISVDIAGGDKFTDEFFLVGGFGSPCDDNSPETTRFSPNSYWNVQFSDIFASSGVNGLQPSNALFNDFNGNGNTDLCEAMYVQNWSIWAQVTVDAPFATAATVNDEVICAGEATILNGSATSGLEPYTYSWSPMTGLTSPTSATTGVTATQTTNYTLTVTDDSGAVSTSNVTVTVDGLTVTAPDGEADCGGTDQIVTVISSPNSTTYTYTWNGLDTAICCGSQADPTNLFQNFTAGTYSITVDDGFCSITEDVTVELANSNLSASYTYNASGNGLTVNFTANSPDAIEFYWDFGNSTYDDGENVSVTYTAGETYTVILTVVDANGCTLDYSEQIVVSFTGVNIEESSLINNLDIFPNPAKNTLNINLESAQSEDVTIELFNAQGQSVITELASNGIFNNTIDVSALANGIYLVNFKFAQGNVTKRFTINK